MEAYIEETPGISGVVCYEYTAIWAPVKNLADSFQRCMA